LEEISNFILWLSTYNISTILRWSKSFNNIKVVGKFVGLKDGLDLCPITIPCHKPYYWVFFFLIGEIFDLYYPRWFVFKSLL
jgi:hypothetical protein